MQVKDGEITQGIVLTLSSGLSIKGRLRRADKQPLPESGGFVIMASGDGQVRQLEVRPDGTFCIDGLKPGKLTLTLTRTVAGLIPERHPEVEAGTKDIEIVLVAAARITGRVVDADGKPFPDALVGAHPKAGVLKVLSYRCDDDGRFSIEVPPSFSGKIVAAVPQNRFLHGSVDQVHAGQRDVEVVLEVVK
ncbi:MAG: hypothetical protein R3F30_03965 [Planctomycetota bacterium]